MEINETLIVEMRRLLAEELMDGERGAAVERPADLQLELEMLGELAMTLGDPVFSLDWDSGGPGAGAGTETVYELAGRYLYLSASFGWSGPFETLDDAYGTIWVSGATRSIWCSEWSEEEIIARMQLNDAPPVLYINGEAWPFETLEHRHARLSADASGDGEG